MTQIDASAYRWDAPLILIFIGVALIVVLLLVVVIRAGRTARLAETLAAQVGGLGHAVTILGQGQDQLHGGLRTVSDHQSAAQTQILQAMETRMAQVHSQMQDRLAENALKSASAMAEMQDRMGQVLHGSSQRTTGSLAQLQERLAVIDQAQANITKLSGDVLSLQDILSNKQTRGAFGEIQLHDIVSNALSPDSYTMQATLSNGKRADCLVHLPNPPGPIVIDSKFPLEAYEALRRATNDTEKTAAARDLRTSIRKHIKDISNRYIIDDETADGALMFLPSEAVYAELHANFPELVRDGFTAKVWIVSPTTCMATLNTMRAILKDARMREQAGAIRATLRQVHRDVEIVVEKVGKLNQHFRQAREDVEGIGTAAERAGKRAARLETFEFDEAPAATKIT